MPRSWLTSPRKSKGMSSDEGQRLIRPAVSSSGSDTAPGRGQPQTPGRRHWRTHGPPHLGTTTPASSARALRRARRRPGPRRSAADPRAPALLSSREGTPAGLSRKTRGRPARRLSPGSTHVSGAFQTLAPESAFRVWLRSLYRQPWVVNAKPPFGSPTGVLHYLARYTHRVAVSNHRLVAVTDDTVSRRWKDCRHGSQIRTLTLGPASTSYGSLQRGDESVPRGSGDRKVGRGIRRAGAEHGGVGRSRVEVVGEQRVASGLRQAPRRG